MRKIHLGLLLPAMMLTTSAYAKVLFQSDKPDAPPPRETFMDYYVASDPPGTSWTLGINLSGTQIVPSATVGNTGHEQAGASSITRGKTIEFNQNPIFGIGAGLLISNGQSGQIIYLMFDYFDKDAKNTTTYASDGSEIQLQHAITEANNTTNYSQVTHSFGYQKTSLAFGLMSFTIQYKGFGINGKFGLAGDYVDTTQNVSGTESATTNVNTQYGKQETYQGGIQGGMRTNLVLTETDTSAWVIGTEYIFTKMMANNTGYVTRSTTTPAGVTTQTLNSSLPDWTKVTNASQSLYLAYTSTTTAPTEQVPDTPFMELRVGVRSTQWVGEDVIAAVIYGSQGDLTINSIFGQISYTM